MITVVAAMGRRTGRFCAGATGELVSAGVAGQDGFTFSPLPPGKYYILSAGQHFEVREALCLCLPSPVCC
jgi:hypothetical protein